MTFAEVACQPILGGSFPGTFGILGGSWLELTLLALFSSLFALTIVFMVANFLRNQPLISWTKFELFQVFGTATILIFSIAWIVGMCQFDMSFLDRSANSDYIMKIKVDASGNPVLNPDGSYIYDPNGSPVVNPTTGNYLGLNMYQIVENYLNYLENIGYNVFFLLMYFSKIITLLQKVTYFSSPLGLGMNDNPLDSLGQINSVIFFMVGGFITSYLLLGMQVKVMSYMAIAILHYMFPFGIFFRAFEPTRGFGGALIGLSLAFFLFYPITMVFNHYIMMAPLKEVDAQLRQVAGNTTPAPDAEEIREGIARTTKNDVATMGSAIGSAMFFFMKTIMFYIMAAVVLPIINFAVLVEITKGLTKVMGEELDVSNLTRLI
ncbi:MAG: hypothetical protein QW568_01720 [Candidatus Anstonellaceae archaeon]